MATFPRRFGAVLFAVVLFAAAVYVPGAPTVDAGPGDINCAVSPFMLYGQRATIVKVGSSGGAVANVSSNAVSDYGWFEEIGYGLVGHEFQPVTILVLDDFSQYDNSAGFAYPTQTSHGFFVMGLLNSWYQQIYRDVTGMGWSSDSYAMLQMNVEAGSPLDVPIVQVIPIDYSGEGYGGFGPELDKSFQTGYLADHLIAMVQELGGGRVVLNMSFVILQCNGLDMQDFVQIRRSNPDFTLIDYLGWDEVMARLEAVDDGSDPLANVVRQLVQYGAQMGANPSGLVLASNPARQSFDMVVPVASSGNYGPGSGPFAPARWPNVIGVSAGQGNTSYDRWPDSSPGEISAPGAYFSLFGNGFYVGGTSFAAPGVSLMMAFDLSKNVPNCQNRNGIPALALGYNGDTAFEDAYVENCNGF